jgi:MFS transporter, putative metabolite transport protein
MDAAPLSSPPPDAKATIPMVPERRYLWALLAMLMSATIFEGYDITIFHLCTPDIARSFNLGDRAIGAIATAVRFGGILSFFVVTLADRYGRKPVIANTVLCYAFFTLMTALSSGMRSFTLFQSASQIFLAAEFGIAITIICEEFPDELRGRAISILHMVAFLGVAAAGLLYGYVAESSWGWRGMYFLGIAPLLAVAWLRRGMRETVRFGAVEKRRRNPAETREGFFTPLWRCLQSGEESYRGRLLLIAALCNCIGLVGGPTISFFSLYAKRDHHWKSSQIGAAIVLAYLMGTVGTLLCGYLLDRIGRRITAALFFLASAFAMFELFRTESHSGMLLALMATMFAYQGARTANSALSSELFPTGARATGYCLTVQVLGQLGWMLSPLAVGALSAPLGGLGKAASLFAAGPLVGIVLILTMVPETRGKTLEELSPETAMPASGAH